MFLNKADMFEKTVAVLLVTLTAIQAIRIPDVTSFALIDEAKAQLSMLRQTVLGAILVADYNLEVFYFELEIYANNTNLEAIVTIGIDELNVNQQLNEIKNFADSANADISYCLQGREDYLTRLSDVILQDLEQCIAEKIEEGEHILNSYKYLIDITINPVDALDFQLGLCQSDSIECISPILEQIELEIVELPQEIEIQAMRASGLFEELKVIVDECAELRVAQYVSSTSTILSDIIQCANAIIG